jgi:hypothetical protein
LQAAVVVEDFGQLFLMAVQAAVGPVASDAQFRQAVAA